MSLQYMNEIESKEKTQFESVRVFFAAINTKITSRTKTAERKKMCQHPCHCKTAWPARG